MTFLEMQTRVGELINQAVTDDTKLVTQTEVKANLNRGYHKVINKIVSLSEDYYVRLAKTNTVANQSLYGLPDDFRKLVRVEIDYEGAGNRYKLRRVDENAYGDPVNVSIDSTSPQYSIRGDNIEIEPTPTAAVTNGIWMWYVENQNDLAADEDEPNLPFEFSDLPIEYAVAKAKAKQGLLDEAQLTLSEFYRELDDVAASLANTNLDDPEQVVIRDEYY